MPQGGHDRPCFRMQALFGAAQVALETSRQKMTLGLKVQRQTEKACVRKDGEWSQEGTQDFRFDQLERALPFPEMGQPGTEMTQQGNQGLCVAVMSALSTRTHKKLFSRQLMSELGFQEEGGLETRGVASL